MKYFTIMSVIMSNIIMSNIIMSNIIMTSIMTTIMTTIMTSIMTNGVNAFQGNATFYGMGGAGIHGACEIDVRDKTTIAINGAQWDSGRVCGRCVEITSNQKGIGVSPPPKNLKATIDNVCSECPFGNLDLGLNGDGIWDIEWEFVEC